MQVLMCHSTETTSLQEKRMLKQFDSRPFSPYGSLHIASRATSSQLLHDLFNKTFSHTVTVTLSPTNILISLMFQFLVYITTTDNLPNGIYS